MKVTDSPAASDCFGDEKVWPIGFRFHPTDEELVLYYLKRKICRKRIELDIIAETDVYKWDPEDLPGKSILKTRDRQWFFFSPRDRKYPNGARSNRATGHGYWKATGKDRTVTCNSRTVGTKKTLVFYRGRAPSGKRTDWVMHEYTVDEKELKKCWTEQDYYALYKVFKKSGPGPRNGEQYGALFKEEDWVDDEYSDVNKRAEILTPAKLHNCADDPNIDIQFQSPLNVVDEIVNCIVDDRALDQQLQIIDHAYSTPQDVGKGTQSTMLEPFLREATVAGPVMVVHPSDQQYCVQQASFDITHSTTSQLQLYEAPEVTSAPGIRKPDTTEEDFLETDDLIGPEPILPNVEEPVKNFPLEELDGMDEFDLFHDAAMFIRDMGPVDQGLVVNPYLNNLENEMVSQLDYQVHHMYDAEEINSQLWTHDPQNGVFPSGESYQDANPLPIAGAVFDNTSTNIPTQGNQNQGGLGNVDGGDKWFTSGLWAFVESIPTTPASASENALVNRAFERMSSFSRVRISARNADAVVAGDGDQRKHGSSKGLLYFSVVGAACTIFWVLMEGIVMSVLGRYMPL